MDAAPLRLQAGLPVLRRDADRLQVGLDPEHRALLPDRPAVRRLLQRLRTPAGAPAPRDPDAVRALQTLLDAGMVHPAGADGAAGLRPERARVHLDAGPGLADLVRPGLRAAGLETVAEPARAGMRLVVREGAVRRADLDPAVREGLPHLSLGTQPGLVEVGPLVVPGRTACQRCVDAHLGAEDPRWPVLVEQAASGPPVPRDPVLLGLALGWVAADLRAWAGGGTPTTWSATVRLQADPRQGPRYRRRVWQRHPACGCAWDAGLAAG